MFVSDSVTKTNMNLDLLSTIANQSFFSNESTIMLISKDRTKLINWAKFTLAKTHRSVIDLGWLKEYLMTRENLGSNRLSIRFMRAEMAFHLQSIVITENARIIIDGEGDDSDIWSAQLKRLGVQTISLDGLDDWDVYIDKADDVKRLAEGRIYLGGLRKQLFGAQGSQYSLNRDANVLSAFGRTVRGNAMLYAHNQGKLYYGLGERGESVDWGLKMRTKCVHVGMGLKHPECFVPIELAICERVPKVRTISSQGQRKLEVMHNAFFMKFKPKFVYYLGGAPGYSLLDYLLTYQPRITIRDPAKLSDNIRGLVVHDQRTFSRTDILPRPSEKGMLINDIRPGRIKKGMVILAPSGSGKSYYAKQGYWVDGDTLVTWPPKRSDGKRWFDVMPAPAQKKMGLQHLTLIEEYARKEKKIVAFNPSWEAINEYNFKIPVVIWIPPEEDHKANLQRRVDEGNKEQPVDIASMIKGRKMLSDYGMTRGYTIVDNVEDAVFDIEWEAQIMSDYQLMIDTLIQAKDMGYESYIGKFRIPLIWSTFDVPRGATIYFQPWVGSNSTEGRMVVEMDNWDGTWVKYRVCDYMAQVRTWNLKRYSDPSKNIDQEKALYELSIIQRDFVASPMEVNGIRFALWSTSNCYNSSDYRKTVTSADFTFYPNIHVGKAWPPGLCNIWYYRDFYSFEIILGKYNWKLKRENENWVNVQGNCDIIIMGTTNKYGYMQFFNLLLHANGYTTTRTFDAGLGQRFFPISYGGKTFTAPFMIQKNGGYYYYDYLSDPSQAIEGYRWMSAKDFIVYCQYNYSGVRFKTVCDEGFDLTHPIANLWGMWFNVDKAGIEVRLQTWFNSQTQWTKTMSSGIRRLTGLTESKMHLWRRMALYKLYGPSECACRKCSVYSDNYTISIRDHDRINGILTDHKKRSVHLVAVAGHMIGMLIASSIGAVDMVRYCDTILGNFSIYDGQISNRGLKAMSNQWSTTGLLGETNYKKGNHLWHSYYDFYSAVATYIVICSKFRMRVNFRAIKVVMRMLDKIKKMKVGFDDGWQAREVGLQALSVKKIS